MSRILLRLLYGLFLGFIVLLTLSVVATANIHARILGDTFLQF